MLPMWERCQFQLPFTKGHRLIGNIGIGNWQHLHTGNIRINVVVQLALLCGRHGGRPSHATQVRD